MRNKHNLYAYLASYINEEINRTEAISALTIQNGIEAFEGGACDTGKEYTVVVKQTRRLNIDKALLADYDTYFDKCELANTIPLTFDNWRKSPL